jgi:hypothetical protein
VFLSAVLLELPLVSFAITVIPEAAEGGYPGPISQFEQVERWVPALASLGRDDNRE